MRWQWQSSGSSISSILVTVTVTMPLLSCPPLAAEDTVVGTQGKESTGGQCESEAAHGWLAHGNFSTTTQQHTTHIPPACANMVVESWPTTHPPHPPHTTWPSAAVVVLASLLFVVLYLPPQQTPHNHIRGGNKCADNTEWQHLEGDDWVVMYCFGCWHLRRNLQHLNKCHSLGM